MVATPHGKHEATPSVDLAARKHEIKLIWGSYFRSGQSAITCKLTVKAWMIRIKTRPSTHHTSRVDLRIQSVHPTTISNQHRNAIHGRPYGRFSSLRIRRILNRSVQPGDYVSVNADGRLVEGTVVGSNYDYAVRLKTSSTDCRLTLIK